MNASGLNHNLTLNLNLFPTGEGIKSKITIKIKRTKHSASAL